MEQTINYKGYDIEIIQDDMCENPNDRGDSSLHFLVYDHNQFYIESKLVSGQEIFDQMHEEPDIRTFDIPNPYRKKGESFNTPFFFFPVYAYIHSGVSLSLGRGTDTWDTSFKGFVMISTEYWPDEEEAVKCAEAVLKEWNDYLSGNVWGYRITDEEGEDRDSCFCYVGDEDYCIDDAKSVVDWYAKDDQKKHWNLLKTWIKNHVPLQYRYSLETY